MPLKIDIEIWGNDPHCRGLYPIDPEDCTVTNATIRVLPMEPLHLFGAIETIEDKIYLLGVFRSEEEANDFALEHAQNRRDLFHVCQASYYRAHPEKKKQRD